MYSNKCNINRSNNISAKQNNKSHNYSYSTTPIITHKVTKTNSIYKNSNSDSFIITDSNKHLLCGLPTIRPNIQYLSATQLTDLHIRTLSIKYLTHLEISHCGLHNLPEELPSTLQTLICIHTSLTKLPTKLPSELTKLNCEYNTLTALPDMLSCKLIILQCNNNNLTALPETLPDTIQFLKCNCNVLTQLPIHLPQQLNTLCCSSNKLETINEQLPPNLKELVCSYNKLVKLPNILPPKLKCLEFHYNLQVHRLPDFPKSLRIEYALNIYSSKLNANYPKLELDLYNYKHRPTESQWYYINECNSKYRTQIRMRIINANDAIWEAYIRRVMHPSKFGAALLTDPNLDIECHTMNYINSL